MSIPHDPLTHPLPPGVPRSPPGARDLPYDDGEPMETYRHWLQMSLMLESLELAWQDRTDFFAGGNMFLYYSELQTRQNNFRGPDVFVVLNTKHGERLSWVVWEEDGKTPDVIIELLSASTEATDRGMKIRFYAQTLHVGEYYLFDPMDGRLEGYELDPRSASFRRMQPEEDGTLSCHRLGLRLGVVHGSYFNVAADWLRWLGPDGAVLPSGQERAEAESLRARELAEKLALYERRFGPLDP